MRSRYTAHVLGNVPYLLATGSPGSLNASLDDMTAWLRDVRWQGLRIISVHQGGPRHKKGEVVFEARYERQGQCETHREHAYFVRKRERWLFTYGLVR